MNLVLNLDEYNENNVFVTESIRNTVIDNSSFMRIIYSTSDVAFNGIFLLVPFANFQISKYFNKWRCNFDQDENRSIIEQIRNVEESLLGKINMGQKQPCAKIYEQLRSSYIKIFLEEANMDNVAADDKILLKISGIWVSEHEYGITYKFILASRP